MHCITLFREAFEKIIALGVSAIAVVDQEGHLLNSVSASNVRLITKENVSWLLLPVSEWLAKLEIKQANNARTTATIKTAIETIRDKREFFFSIWLCLLFVLCSFPVSRFAPHVDCR